MFHLIKKFDFCTVSKILTWFSLIMRFLNNHKRYSSHLQVSILHQVAPTKGLPNNLREPFNSYLKKVFVP